jgi:hypothetical protein
VQFSARQFVNQLRQREKAAVPDLPELAQLPAVAPEADGAGANERPLSATATAAQTASTVVAGVRQWLSSAASGA